MVEMGSPLVDRDNAWEVYQTLLMAFQILANENAEVQGAISEHQQQVTAENSEFPADEIMPVLPFQEYRFGDRPELDVDADNMDEEDEVEDIVEFSDEEGYASSGVDD